MYGAVRCVRVWWITKGYGRGGAISAHRSMQRYSRKSRPYGNPSAIIITAVGVAAR
jgi:hypothetical protein